jgi:glycosyltransferase involved in cell wall biosynthesis
MRILILHSTYLSGPVSGENRVVADESRLLREAGHEVGVWAPTPAVSGALGAMRAGMSAVWSLKVAREVGETVRRRKVEIVHVHNLFPGLSPAVLRSARSAGASVLVTLHNFRLMCLPANLLRDGEICEACVGHLPWRGIVHRCYRDSVLGSAALATSLVAHRSIGTFDGVQRFLAVSGFVRDKYIESGMRSEQVEVKPNFTWPLDHRNGPGEYFLYLGRLAPEKGVDTLIEAWRSSAPRHPLVVIGDGPDADILRRDAPAGVEFRGRVSAEDAGKALARARALMVPSRWYEAAPRSIIEAYAAGVPVVASHIGALPEAVIDGISGLLAAPDDAKAWAEAAGSLDDDTSVRLGAGALGLWGERFSPEQGLDGLEAAYRGAVAVGA